MTDADTFCEGYQLSEVVTLKEIMETLQLHHSHHMRSGPAGVQDGQGNWTEIDLAEAYQESSLCERTCAVLARIRKREEPR